MNLNLLTPPPHLWFLISAPGPPPQMLPGFENLLFAHSSWYTYAATMRIYKHWDFHITEPHAATGKLSFSSYPGTLVPLLKNSLEITTAAVIP